MKINKAGHRGPGMRKCPPGMKLVNGKCVKKDARNKHGIPILPDAPTRGIALSEDRCAIILKAGKVLLNWASLRKTSPLFGLDVRKPLYLISQKKGGVTEVVGIVTARNIDADSKTRISLRRAFRPARSVVLKQKPVDLMVPKRDMKFVRPVDPEPAKGGLVPKGKGLIDIDSSLGISRPALDKLGNETQDGNTAVFPQTEKVLHGAVGKPSSEGGSHTHSLIRSEARTMNNGQHFHILDHPEFGRLVSDIDGQHFHAIEGDKTDDKTSAHSHVFGLPNGEVLRTEVDGIADHDVLLESTDNGGVHVHKIKVNGQTMTTLSSAEEAMEMGPGLGDPQDEDQVEGSGHDEDEMPEALRSLLNSAEVDFQKAWDAADEAFTLKTLVEKQTTVQSVVLAKSRFGTEEVAKEWMKDHGFSTDKVDEKPNTFRFRQFSPGRCKEGTFRNKRITRGVIAVICVPKGSETPSGLKAAGNAMAHELKKGMQKKVIESSTVRVDHRPTGFSFKRVGDILFAFKDEVKGERTGKLETVLVRQRLNADGMDKAPTGAIDAMEIETAPANSNPKELAKENIGTLILILEKVKGSDRLVESDAFLAVLDPTKQAPEKGCGCQD